MGLREKAEQAWSNGREAYEHEQAERSRTSRIHQLSNVLRLIDFDAYRRIKEGKLDTDVGDAKHGGSAIRGCR